MAPNKYRDGALMLMTISHLREAATSGARDEKYQ